MIFYGVNGKVLATKELPNETCTACQQKGLTMALYSQYAHLYWIPFVPYSKPGKTICNSCGFVNEQKNLPLQQQEDLARLKMEHKIPFYHFSGLGIVAIIIALVSAYSWNNKKEMASILEQPMVGDMYLVYEVYDEPGSYPYSLLKVIAVADDSVSYVYSDRTYNLPKGFADDIKKGLTADSTYFYNEFYYTEALADIKAKFEKDEIKEVIRK